MTLTRAQWPHTVDDIVNSLDGIWGLVGAQDPSGNLWRLERSLHEPLTFTLTEFAGADESKIVSSQVYPAGERTRAIEKFARALGFSAVELK